MQNTSNAIDGLKILLAAQSCLILDPSKSSAANLRAALRQFGMAAGKIFTAATVEEAEAFLIEKKPTILIVDFQEQSSESFRLVEVFEGMHSENLRVALLAASGEVAPLQSDGQIDGHIAKPFNLDGLRRTLLKAMITKFYPDAYMKKVLQADALANKGEDEAALAEYEAAKTLNPQGLRVHRGLASVHQRNGRFERARIEFGKAREFSALDYKAVTGEFDVLLTLGDFGSAAKLVSLFHDSFPKNSARLKRLFETVTAAQRFDELGPLLKSFRSLPERSEELVKVVQDSFFAAGRTALATNEKLSALQYFDAGFQVATHRFDYFEKVVREFLQTGLREEAENFLAKAMPEALGTSAYQRICFELDCLVLPIDSLLDRGRRLIFDGHGSPEVFSKMVSLFGSAGKVTMAEAVIAKATESFPSLRESLYEILSESVEPDEVRKAA